jgi:hypothetical protein
MQKESSQLPAESPLSIWNIAQRLEENFKRVESILRKLEEEGAPESQIAAAAELRQHIALAEKALSTAVEAHAVEEFQQAVLDALAEAGPLVRKRVIDVLSARQTGPPRPRERIPARFRSRS